MKQHYTDDRFLARWISGELSPEELEAFKKSEDFPIFKKINEATQNLQTPDYNKEAALQRLQDQINNTSQSTKTIKLIPNWAYGIAAMLIVALGLLYFVNKDTRVYADFGEQLAITLPDESSINLNANSEIEYNSKNWENSREIKLNGEAFFKVNKGKTFKVKTHLGEVEVLGTSFNVIAQDSYFEVKCHEGKVKVINAKMDEVVLEKGNAVRLLNNDIKESWNLTQTLPSWLNGESTFENTPLSEVITALENQFNIKVIRGDLDKNLRFTGSFTHKELKLALQTIFVPMEISYTFKDENTLVLVKE